MTAHFSSFYVQPVIAVKYVRSLRFRHYGPANTTVAAIVHDSRPRLLTVSACTTGTPITGLVSRARTLSAGVIRIYIVFYLLAHQYIHTCILLYLPSLPIRLNRYRPWQQHFMFSLIVIGLNFSDFIFFSSPPPP